MDSRRFNIEDSGYRCEQRIRFGTDKTISKGGHEVAAGMRANSNSDALDSLKKEYSNRLRLSVGYEDESTMAHSADLIKSQWGSLDVIINNAGILLGRNRKFNELDLEELITSFKVNTFGPMMLIKHLAGLMEVANPYDYKYNIRGSQ